MESPRAPLIRGSSIDIKIRPKLPDFLQTVNLKYVKLGYHIVISHAMYPFMLPLVLTIFAEVRRLSHHDVGDLWRQLEFNLVSVLVTSGALVFGVTLYYMTRPYPVYLVDYACYKPSDSDNNKISAKDFIAKSMAANVFIPENIDLQRKIIERSGLGDETYLPPAVLCTPPNPNMASARTEAENVMFGALDELFEETGVKPKDISILIVNCSLFNPTPSLSAMIINHYKMRGNIHSVNLGGMGCSAGIIAIDLAKDLLQVHPNSYAIVMSHENITQNWYFGNDRSKIVPNCIFRMGGAAMLLTNKWTAKFWSKYELLHTMRTHKGADKKCFECVYQEEDSSGIMGLSLSRDLMSVAGDALKANITTLGPLVLPLSEQLLFFASLVGRKLFKMKLNPYIPDFTLAFEHFCIHAGGRAVLDEMEKNLQLTEWHMEPSRMTLYRFGNTSSSSPWYELAYSEAKGRIRRGDRVWQIAFGSGFKCSSAVWRALRSLKPPARGPWTDCIDKFPVEIPAVPRVAAKKPI